MNEINATEYPITLETWNCTMSVLVSSEGIYFPLRQLCSIIGIADAQQQAEYLQARRVTKNYIRKLPIMTGRGRRLAWCIKQDIVGYWLGYIDERLVRPEIVDGLIQFQEDLRAAAKGLLLRDFSAPVTLDEAASSIIPITHRLGPVRGPVVFSDDDL